LVNLYKIPAIKVLPTARILPEMNFQSGLFLVLTNIVLRILGDDYGNSDPSIFAENLQKLSLIAKIDI